MSYAQWHYPFENKETFESHFPADYICEAIDQTRGWFYTLHAIATLVSDSVAFKNCICLNLIVDQDGKKMSKSVGNIVDPYDVFDIGRRGCTALVFSCAPEPRRPETNIGRDRSGCREFFHQHILEHLRLLRALRAHRRRTICSKIFRSQNGPEIDRWAIALLNQTVRTCTEALDEFRCQALRAMRSSLSSTSSATGMSDETVAASGNRPMRRTSDLHT